MFIKICRRMDTADMSDKVYKYDKSIASSNGTVPGVLLEHIP